MTTPASKRTEFRYSYDHTPTLARFALSNAFIRGILGPVGSGKSSASVVEIVRRGQQQKPGPDGVRRTRFAVIRQTYPQLEDTTMKTFFEWMPPAHFGHAAGHDYTITKFENCEIEVMFRALDRPDQVANLRSLDLTGAWVNEAREIDWSIIDMLQTRLGRYPSQRTGGPTWYGMWLDTNPPDADSDWYRFFEDEKWREALETLKELGIPPTHETFAEIFRQPDGLSTEAENIPNLPGGRGYYANLMMGKGKEWVDVFIRGKYGFITDGRAIFPEYSDERHCRKVDPIPGMPIFRGWDFGLTPACVFSQLQPNGQWLVFDEITSESSGITAFAEVVQRYCSVVFPGAKTRFIDYGDPAGMQRAQTDERTCFQILHGKGVMIEPGMQTLATRLEAIRKPLVTMVDKKPQFILHPRCAKLRRGFLGQYKFRRLRIAGNNYSDMPEKNEVSHPMDALQYVATRIFGTDLFIPPQAQREEAEYAARQVYDFESYEPDAGRSEHTGY